MHSSYFEEFTDWNIICCACHLLYPQAYDSMPVSVGTRKNWRNGVVGECSPKNMQHLCDAFGLQPLDINLGMDHCVKILAENSGRYTPKEIQSQVMRILVSNNKGAAKPLPDLPNGISSAICGGAISRYSHPQMKTMADRFHGLYYAIFPISNNIGGPEKPIMRNLLYIHAVTQENKPIPCDWISPIWNQTEWDFRGWLIPDNKNLNFQFELAQENLEIVFITARKPTLQNFHRFYGIMIAHIVQENTFPTAIPVVFERISETDDDDKHKALEHLEPGCFGLETIEKDHHGITTYLNSKLDGKTSCLVSHTL